MPFHGFNILLILAIYLFIFFFFINLLSYKLTCRIIINHNINSSFLHSFLSEVKWFFVGTNIENFCKRRCDNYTFLIAHHTKVIVLLHTNDLLAVVVFDVLERTNPRYSYTFIFDGEYRPREIPFYPCRGVVPVTYLIESKLRYRFLGRRNDSVTTFVSNEIVF